MPDRQANQANTYLDRQLHIFLFFLLMGGGMAPIRRKQKNVQLPVKLNVSLIGLTVRHCLCLTGLTIKHNLCQVMLDIRHNLCLIWRSSIMAGPYTCILKYLCPWVVFGRFRMVSDRFRTISDGFGRFRIVFGRFRTVSDRFGSFSDRFRTTKNPSKIFSVGPSGQLKTLQKCFR